MAGRFERKPFGDINLGDPFFDELKRDYPEFATDWFPKCVRQGREALVFSDENGLGAFIALKEEKEELVLVEKTLPNKMRLKISTLRLAERFRGQRLGEGAIGLILWQWQSSGIEEVYVTVFESHDDLIAQLERFGFKCQGHNERGELVYLRSRSNIDFSDPYKAFPFLSTDFKKGGYLIVNDTYHDTLFPYSEVKYTVQNGLDIAAANGVSKIYIGQQREAHYRVGEPLFIYRRYTGVQGAKRYKSCLTSYAIVTDVVYVKRNRVRLISFEDFCKHVGNKSVFSKEELRDKYQSEATITVVKMLYGGFFGEGNNINMDWLACNGLWSSQDCYPAQIKLTPKQCETIFEKGKINKENLFGM